MDDENAPFGDRWYTAVAALHRRLAGEDVPLVSTHGQWEAELPVKFAGLYGFMAVLGWTDLGRGVEQWLGGGVTVGGENEVHGRLREAIDIGGRFEALAWWVWMRKVHVVEGYVMQGAHVHDPGLRPCPFAREVVAEVHGLAADNDALHATGHLTCVSSTLLTGGWAGVPGHRPEPKFETILKYSQRRGVVLTDRFEGYPLALGRLARELPTGKPAWIVDVVSRRDGWLGQFRRCWTCGRWFMGSAVVHAWGHAATSGEGK